MKVRFLPCPPKENKSEKDNYMNKKATWFLEETAFQEDLEPMKREIIKQGFTLKTDKYTPFQGGTYHQLFDSSECVIFYGSLNLAKQLSEDRNFHPHIYCTMRNYECSKYYAYLGKFLLNSHYAMLPFSELKRNREFLFERFGQFGVIFVRPNTGDKIFTGQLVHDDNFDHDYELLGFYDVPPECLIVISEPRNITGEWRFVVSDKKLISWSAYKTPGVEIPTPAMHLAEEVSNGGYEPDPVWTIDICQTTDGEFHLLEIGSFSCAGLYDCKMEPIVREVSRITLEQDEGGKVNWALPAVL